MVQEKKISISIIVPAYNEEYYIRLTIEELVPVLNEISDVWEIVVVDDASTDNTPKVLKELIDKYKHIVVLRNPVNLKLGGSLKRGFYAAKNDLVCYIDADLPFDFHELKRAVRYMQRCDIMCAYRHDRTCEGLKRVIYTYFYNWIITILFQHQIRDVNFSFKLFKRKILDDIKLESEGSFLDAEFTIKAERLGYKIYQIGVDYFPRREGESTLSSFSVILKILREMMKFWWKIYIKNQLPRRKLTLNR
jgi:glycosyltransferase involved in cell wall biosynthesis